MWRLDSQKVFVLTAHLLINNGTDPDQSPEL
jgi:hypothetical protein